MQYEAQITVTREATDLSLVCTVLTGGMQMHPIWNAVDASRICLCGDLPFYYMGR
jgi:hypothetical protein